MLGFLIWCRFRYFQPWNETTTPSPEWNIVGTTLSDVFFFGKGLGIPWPSPNFIDITSTYIYVPWSKVAFFWGWETSHL